ncbi:MAG: hypothetical protein IH946_12845, partial [Bacteroidetes bacterium]|nr:hypothetical protein [Bacteroidota bacterium]
IDVEGKVTILLLGHGVLEGSDSDTVHAPAVIKKNITMASDGRIYQRSAN